MNKRSIQLLLADDDKDDRDLFTDALEELKESTILTTVDDGEQLMRYLSTEAKALPDILFLDLNMLRKNGYECLSEIQMNDKLKAIPVIVFSTSYDKEIVDLLYQTGARHYIRKPNDFELLKKVVHNALSATFQVAQPKITMDNFVVQP